MHERGERLGVDVSGLGNGGVRAGVFGDGVAQVVEDGHEIHDP
jgi:hypothetical protein